MSRGSSAPPSRPGGPRDIPQLLARFPVVTPETSSAGAAVTIVLRPGEDGTEVLLIERSRRPDDPASGEVALPGGRVDGGDANLAATAIRELEEEVGLRADDLAGPLHFVRHREAPRFGLRVGVFAAELASGGRGPSVHQSDEVSHVFWIPSARLDPPDLVRTETRRGTIEVPATVFEGHVLWGFTRRVVREFFDLPVEPEVYPTGVRGGTDRPRETPTGPPRER